MTRRLITTAATMAALAIAAPAAGRQRRLWSVDGSSTTAPAPSPSTAAGYGRTGRCSALRAGQRTRRRWAQVRWGSRPDTGTRRTHSSTPANSVTVSAWIERTGSPGAYKYVVAKGGHGCIAASYGLCSGPNGGLQFYVSRGGGTVYARSPDAGAVSLGWTVAPSRRARSMA